MSMVNAVRLASEDAPSFDAAQYASAMLNILEDIGQEKLQLEETQKAVLNILDDLGAEVEDRSRLQERFRAMVENAPDAIVIVNDAGHIVLVNAQTENLFGYRRDELVGQTMEVLVPERFRGNHPRDRARFAESSQVRPMGPELELYGLRKDASEFAVEIQLSPLATEEGVLFSAAIRDVSRTKDNERQIRASLEEKEALLQEIHHRVKNNLQIIASLLSLQSGYVTDPLMLAQYQESQGRIRSMALIHEKLYQSASLARVDLADYTDSLVGILVRTYTTHSNVTLDLRVQPMTVSIDTAVPVGLLLNELVTNALKYAFPQGRVGRLLVELIAIGDGAIALRVEDDGVGLGPDFQFDEVQSLGLRLVRMFARQLRAQVQVSSRPGHTAFQVRFGEAADKLADPS